MVKVCLRELRRDLKAFLFWSLGVAALIGATLAKTGTLMEEGAGGLGVLVAVLPRALQNLFGLGVVDLSSPIGLFAVILLYVSLIACYHAASLGAGAFAREERDRTFEFLYVRPIARGQILAGKVLAGVMEMAALNLITFIACAAAIGVMGGESGRLGQMLLGMFVMQIFFYAAGLLASLLTRSMKLVAASSALATGLFLLAMAIDLVPGLKMLSPLTPFKVFDAKRIYQNGIDGPAMAVWTSLSAGVMALAFRLHKWRDLHT